MGFMDKLYKTYESNIHMAGKQDDISTLPVISHIIANSQIEITINGDGQFIRASVVSKDDSKTMIPVTEDSASRANIVAPHALNDMLPYIAGDYSSYISKPKEIKTSTEKFEKYSDALEKWALSEYTHQKVKAVYLYITKKQMITNLISAGVVECKEDGKLSDKKINGKEYEKALVRFIVLGSEPTATWQDLTLSDIYHRYYTSNKTDSEDVCYLTGERDVISVKHLKGIVAASYGAKLISANDTSNFVFRGRFETPNEACTIAYESTQKAHCALSWLAAKQGINIGMQSKRTFICWNPNGKEVADISNPFGFEKDEETKPYTEEIYKQKLKETINGYRNKLDKNDDIVIIALDAATTGRLSVTYYNELKASDFYDRLQNWYETCCWFYTGFTNDKKPYIHVSTPLTKQIVNCAFGTERGAFVETDDKVMKEQYQRILSCMLDSQPIPRDIVHALAIHASTPLAYSKGNFERLLSTACAVIKKYYNDKYKGVKYAMKLDLKNTERSYVFGRLLAVCEYVEEKAMRVKYAKTGSSDDRDTNAIRYMSAFSNRPLYTFKIIRENIKPYFTMLNQFEQNNYNSLISEIFELILHEDENKLNQALNETYLIGYYLQRSELKNQIKKTQEETNNE